MVEEDVKRLLKAVKALSCSGVMCNDDKCPFNIKGGGCHLGELQDLAEKHGVCPKCGK